MGAAHVRGLQGSNGTYLKTAATCKVRRAAAEEGRQRARSAGPRPPCRARRPPHPCPLAALAHGHRPLHHPVPAPPPARPLPARQHFIGNDLEGWQDPSPGGLFITRHNFDAKISARDMRDTYLVPFEACIRDAAAASFMCSYNRGEGRGRGRGTGGGLGLAPCRRRMRCARCARCRPRCAATPHAPRPMTAVNGTPRCVNPELLQGVLRKQLGFKGYVVTDCTGAPGACVWLCASVCVRSCGIDDVRWGPVAAAAAAASRHACWR